MTLVLPIVITALILGMFSKKTSPGLWTVMIMAILITIVVFYAKH